MIKPGYARIIFFRLLVFCLPVLLVCCKKEPVKLPVSLTCFDYMTVDSNMNFPEAPYANYYYYNKQHQLISHIVTSGGDVAWSDTFAYDHGRVVKSWMSLDGNSTANYYTRNEYDYTDTLMTASRYYLGNTLIVHSAYGYNEKGQLSSYAQYSNNTELQTDPDYTYYLTYDNNDNVTQLADPYGNVVARYLNYDDHPNLGYKMPFDWAYDIFTYFNVFAKHNVGQQIYYKYNAYTTGTDTTSYTFTYTYMNGNIATVTDNGSVLTKISSLCK
jgi:hypothetical protein